MIILLVNLAQCFRPRQKCYFKHYLRGWDVKKIAAVLFLIINAFKTSCCCDFFFYMQDSFRIYGRWIKRSQCLEMCCLAAKQTEFFIILFFLLSSSFVFFFWTSTSCCLGSKRSCRILFVVVVVISFQES